MDNVREKVVVLKSVVGIDSFVVDGECASPDASLVFRCGVRPELSSEDIEDLLPDPPAFGECCEREVIRVDFP